jgi:hypothetical protein
MLYTVSRILELAREEVQDEGRALLPSDIACSVYTAHLSRGSRTAWWKDRKRTAALPRGFRGW